jgi:hypothetical protein
VSAFLTAFAFLPQEPRFLPSHPVCAMLNKRRITIKGDRVLEADELFGVRLSAPVNAHLADGTGWGTIQNDDSAPTTAQSPGLSSPSGSNS